MIKMDAAAVLEYCNRAHTPDELVGGLFMRLAVMLGDSRVALKADSTEWNRSLIAQETIVRLMEQARRGELVERRMDGKLIQMGHQPAYGVEVVTLYRHPDDARGYHNHAMTVGLSGKTQFWHCPHGVPDDVVCADGVWCWRMPAKAEA